MQFWLMHCSDAYKEFEKEIQANLQVVDDRLEEEEVSYLPRTKTVLAGKQFSLLKK